MITIPSRSPLVLASTAVAVAALALAGCTSTVAATEEPASEQPAGAELHDLLPDDIKEAGVIKAGALFQTPPGIGADPEDPSRPVGIVPDLAELIEPLLGVEIEFVDTQWPNQIPGLQSGNLDILWGNISDNAERERSAFDFVPFMGGQPGLLVADGNPESIDSIGSMCGLTLAVGNGSNIQEIAAAISDEVCTAEGEPAIETLALQGGADAYSAIKAGTADAWYESYSGVTQIAASDDAFDAVQTPLEEVPVEMRSLNGIAATKDAAALTEAIFAAMAEIRENGDYAEVLAAWNVADEALTDDLFRINPFTDTPVGEVAG